MVFNGTGKAGPERDLQKLRQRLIPASNFIKEFRKPLSPLTAWRNGGDRAAREKALAIDYLKRHDYLRATQFGYESFVSSEVCAKRRDPNDMDERTEAENTLYVESKAQPPETPGNFKTIKNLRNSLAHGVMDTDRKDKSSKFIKKLSSNETDLQRWLTKTLQIR